MSDPSSEPPKPPRINPALLRPSHPLRKKYEHWKDGMKQPHEGLMLSPWDPLDQLEGTARAPCPQYV
jgi:hypothetical protein